MRKISLIPNAKNIVFQHNHPTEHTNALCAKLQSFDLETDGIYSNLLSLNGSIIVM